MDIDSAAKYIGAGAATVGVAGSGKKSCLEVQIAAQEKLQCCIQLQITFLTTKFIVFLTFPLRL